MRRVARVRGAPHAAGVESQEEVTADERGVAIDCDAATYDARIDESDLCEIKPDIGRTWAT